MSTQASPPLEPGIASIREALQAQESALLPLPDSELDETHAAVSLILRDGPVLEILLIRRAEADGDPWSGHMAFPGGRRSPRDGSLQETATRETLEETGVKLKDEGTPLGRLRSLAPSTYRLPPISIFPFVFSVARGIQARVASREVDEVLWVPLTSFMDPASKSTTPVQVGPETLEFPCFDVDGRVVWGLTYRIISDFLRVLPDPFSSG